MSDLPKFEPLPNIGNVVSNNVTAFNQGYNLYQCINYLQCYVSIVYESMDALLADWNNFQQVVNENITNIATEETQKILNQWVEDGTLNDLIAQNPLWNQKLDKSGGTMTGNIKFSENTKIVGTTPGGNDIDLIHNTNDGASGNYVQFGDPDAKTVINSSQQPVWHNGDDDYLLLTQKQLDDETNKLVKKSGDTMTGNLNLNASLNMLGKITRDEGRYTIFTYDTNNTFLGDNFYKTVIRSKDNTTYLELNTGLTTPILTGNDVVDNLTSEKEQLPLSANQGKVLNDKFSGILNNVSKFCYVSKVLQISSVEAVVDLFTQEELKEMLGVSTDTNFNNKISAFAINGTKNTNAANVVSISYIEIDKKMQMKVNTATVGSMRANILIVYSEEGE